MAEEVKEEVKAEKPEPVGTDPNVTEQADLGAAVGVGEDYDQPAEEELSEEEKAAQLEAAKVVQSDPTKGMKPEEKAEYWRSRANHFESEYKGERGKRQAYDKRYGGLNQLSNSHAAPRAPEPDVSSLDEVKDVREYTRFVVAEAKKQFQHEMTQRQLDERIESSEVRAREIHDGKDGLPAYDELIDELVVPMVHKNPKIFELLRHMPDPAEASYTLGFLLKYQNFADIIKSQSREELIQKINGTAKATVKGRNSGHQPSGKLTKADIDAMSPEDFEKELEKFRAGA